MATTFRPVFAACWKKGVMAAGSTVQTFTFRIPSSRSSDRMLTLRAQTAASVRRSAPPTNTKYAYQCGGTGSYTVLQGSRSEGCR